MLHLNFLNVFQTFFFFKLTNYQSLRLLFSVINVLKFVLSDVICWFCDVLSKLESIECWVAWIKKGHKIYIKNLTTRTQNYVKKLFSGKKILSFYYHY